MAMNQLSDKDVYRQAPLTLVTEKTTKNIEPLSEIIGQDRAKQAVAFAMSMPDRGYNIYAVGDNGLGKRTMILRYLNRLKSNGNGRYDWCYVSNFAVSREPSLLKLPAGMAQTFKKDVENWIAKLVKTLPIAFENERYYHSTEQLKAQLSEQQAEAVATVSQQAKIAGVALSMTNEGEYQFVAMNGEEPHTEESFMALSSKERAAIESCISKLELQLRAVIREMTQWEQDYSDEMQRINEQTAQVVVQAQLTKLLKKYQDHDNLVAHLQAVEADIYENLEIFLDDSDAQTELSYATLDKSLPRRYQINVMVAHDKDEMPIVVEENPNYPALFGYIENATYKGTVFTDFSLIRSGSLHRANGGVLLMDAVKVLERPYVWDGLKRALRANAINMNALEREVSLSGGISLEPQPMPLNVKIILFGDYHTYRLLQQYDAEFTELFRITADFEEEMVRNDETERSYARFIARILQESEMLHCDRPAMARVIEYSARQAQNQNRLSLHSGDIANLLREANYQAKEAGATKIGAGHVEKALATKEYRVSRVRDSVLDGFRDGVTLIDIKGEVVGQVNALAVMATNDHSFGMPNRITATVAHGEGEFLDIERKARLGGQIHSKGVMILSAYLSALFGQHQTMPLKTHLTFEQSYGGVDGDSASMAELCAIVSAMSGIPVAQHFAITGSMNQFGEAQPIGGVNEKIEGFFDVCTLKGPMANQGVIIPRSNQQHLMLRKDVVSAIERGEFHIYVVDHVTDAIALLLQRPAGLEQHDEQISFAKGSVYACIAEKFEQRWQWLAQHAIHKASSC
ncbi:Lon protease [Vibrio stylophorae]|uniref:endopeptidase La n=1 Tax=Vibrio stylophorae TaxID=659351 RepID=A0ABN8DWN9_9VIBR|nr:ATP-binding protein [Vibrio stylophorae]CAH0535417.1 Lon protease [Vibrio stylophorae]